MPMGKIFIFSSTYDLGIIDIWVYQEVNWMKRLASRPYSIPLGFLLLDVPPPRLILWFTTNLTIR